jgi:hypothetical protein
MNLYQDIVLEAEKFEFLAQENLPGKPLFTNHAEKLRLWAKSLCLECAERKIYENHGI